jgi:organic hydroperoxide reductase OsmC/OhrA
MSAEHTYRARCSWRGSTGVGYREYHREHDVSAPPARDSLALSADAAFLGQPDRLNPEQLVVMAAASCQLLSFLAVAARARVDVLSYEDDAVGMMREDDPPIRLTRILLQPRILVSAGPTMDKVCHLVEVAHRECYIANSLRTEVAVQPQVEFSGHPLDESEKRKLLGR